jgi:acetyl esterase
VSLDPEIAALLPALNDGFPRVETMTVPRLRAVIRERAQLLQNPEPVARVIEQTVPGPAGEVNVRIYWPNPTSGHSGSLPVIVFAHGGGFVFCDLDSHDDLCRAMTNGVGAIVVSVDYRRAPESRWPAAVDDVYAVADWSAGQAGELGADPARVVVAGDSAGGNLATVAALLARDRGRPEIAGQLLI